jgi:hypothetical protein
LTKLKKKEYKKKQKPKNVVYFCKYYIDGGVFAQGVQGHGDNHSVF